MAVEEKWKWQEPGTTWKGVGLYHITLTITDRQPLLGTLAIPNNDPTMAKVNRTTLGNALVDCLLDIPSYYPEVQVLHFCLMPDHLHAVLYVRRTMQKGIGTIARGFWQAAKKLGRASMVASFVAPNNIRANNQEGENKRHPKEGENKRQPQEGENKRQPKEGENERQPQEGESERQPQEGYGFRNLQEQSNRLKVMSATLREKMGNEAYYRLTPIFTEMPFIRPMGHNTQLPNTIRYIDMNPQRLATKRLKPGYFRVQRDIEIGERKYDGVGNVTLLMAEQFGTVHVRRTMVEAAERGDNTALRNYMNSCVLTARKGMVMVSPFISPQEKQVMEVLLREQLPFILLTDNGFRDYYKPADGLFEACASGRLLILSPWPYDANKRHISRADCVALNAMAEEICNQG